MTAAEITDEVKRQTEMLFAVGRIADKTRVADNGCVEFTGALNSKGYGVISFRGSRVLTHRLAYEYHKGPIPPGMQIDHLCRNRKCCNPDHLEVVTQQENQARRPDANKTHCKRGHEYTPENTIVKPRPNGRVIRNCRTCANEQRRLREFVARNVDRSAGAA